jgi:hypothetical protein
MKKKRKAIISLAIIMLIALVVGTVMMNPLLWPKDQIEKKLLQKIPIGTSMDEAIVLIENNNWIIREAHDIGYGIRNGTPRFGDTPTVCSKSMRVTLGHYFGDGVWVSAYFGFDDGYLVDITVIKEYL